MISNSTTRKSGLTRYEVTTGEGSRITIMYSKLGYIKEGALTDDPTGFEVGDVYIKGTSKDEPLEFIGMGFVPEVGGKIGVHVKRGKERDAISYELIVEVDGPHEENKV